MSAWGWEAGQLGPRGASRAARSVQRTLSAEPVPASARPHGPRFEGTQATLASLHRLVLNGHLLCTCALRAAGGCGLSKRPPPARAELAA